MPSSDTTTKRDLDRLWDEIEDWDDREKLIEYAEDLAEDDENTAKRFGFSETERQPASATRAPSYNDLTDR